MPKGRLGEKRPAESIGYGVHVMRIATGEIKDAPAPLSPAAEIGRKGGKARAEAMTPERRAKIAKAAAAKRWENHSFCINRLAFRKKGCYLEFYRRVVWP
jgi:hypothetical protein